MANVTPAMLKWAAKLFAGLVGAAFAFISTVYNAVRWFIDNAKKIQALFKRVTTAFRDLISGASVGQIADSVEETLAGVIAPAMDAVAKFLNLGGIPKTIRKGLEKVREWIHGKIKKLLDLIVAPFRGKRKKRKSAETGADQLLPETEWRIERKNGKKEHHELWVETDGKTVKVKMASDQERDVKMFIDTTLERLKQRNTEGSNKKEELADAEKAKALIGDIKEMVQKVTTAFGKPKKKTEDTKQAVDAAKRVAKLQSDLAKLIEKLQGDSCGCACAVAADGSCFEARTPLHLGTEIREMREMVSSPRMLTYEEMRTKALRPGESDPTNVDPVTWQQVFVTLDRGHFGRVDAELLRPMDWFATHDVRVGRYVYLKLKEMGVEGHARVTEIRPCPSIEPGRGRVCTGVFRHSRGWVYDLKLEGETQPLGGTGTHLIWSESRKAWLHLAELRIGEEVKTLSGTARVESLSKRSQPEPVYNIEVEGDHVYRVGESGVLVHNLSNMCHIYSPQYFGVGGSYSSPGGPVYHTDPTTKRAEKSEARVCMTGGGSPASQDPVGWKKSWNQGLPVGKRRVARCHLLGDHLGGAGTRDNLVPCCHEKNRDMETVELQVAAFIAQHGCADIQVIASYV